MHNVSKIGQTHFKEVAAFEVTIETDIKNALIYLSPTRAIELSVFKNAPSMYSLSDFATKHGLQIAPTALSTQIIVNMSAISSSVSELMKVR